MAARFDLNIVPHTLRETIFAGYAPGSRVNLEVDLIARYLERAACSVSARGPSPVPRPLASRWSLLARAGFLG